MRTFFLRGVIPAFVFLLFISPGSLAQTGSQSTVSDSAQTATTTEVKASVQTVPAEASYTAVPESPKLNPTSPAIEFQLDPHPSKLNAPIQFDLPESASKSAPRAFQATAYSLRGRTASGVETGPGVVAADPRVLPLGSLVHIKAGGYSGVYTVHDTGGAVKGNLVDVWLPSSKEARIFGRRQIKLQVLRYGPVARTKKSK